MKVYPFGQLLNQRGHWEIAQLGKDNQREGVSDCIVGARKAIFMGIKDDFDKAVDWANDAIADVNDAANEATHRSSAEAEQTKRKIAGNYMAVGERVGSMVNQSTNIVQADIYAAKRDVRENT
jgi:hypothetical protein